jgi:hypothetical protein
MRTSRELWEGNAQPLKMQLDGVEKLVQPRVFSSGSCGYHASYKSDVVLDGEPCKVQVNVCVTVIGSKPPPAQQGLSEALETPRTLLPPFEPLATPETPPGASGGLPEAHADSEPFQQTPQKPKKRQKARKHV